MSFKLDLINLTCLLLQVIATCIRRMLCDDAELDTLLGSGVSAETKDAIKMLGECTYHLLTASSFSQYPVYPLSPASTVSIIPHVYSQVRTVALHE